MQVLIRADLYVGLIVAANLYISLCQQGAYTAVSAFLYKKRGKNQLTTIHIAHHCRKVIQIFSGRRSWWCWRRFIHLFLEQHSATPSRQSKYIVLRVGSVWYE